MKHKYLPSTKALATAGLIFWNGISPAQPLDPPEVNLSQTLQAIETRLQDSLTNDGQRRAGEPLDTLVQQLNNADVSVQAEFDQIGTHLRTQNLPAVILQRHEQAVNQYQSEMASLQEQLADFKAGNQADESRTRQALQRLQSQTTPLTQFVAKTPSQVREPLLTVKALEAQFPPPSTVTRSSRQTRDGNKPRPPDLNDLAAFGEVQITPDIQALAEELGNHPVSLYYWVRNNISFVPSYGAIQGSQQTLLSRRGNAYDTASLLIALLRAAQVPARYVYGTVQMPAKQVMNWLGGVETPEAAMQLLNQGGIPHTAQIEGGQITALTLEHLWVDAWVDYMPSRAAKNYQGDSWIPLDASFKLHDFAGGIDWKVSFAADNFANQLQTGSAYDATSLTSLDETLLQSTLTSQQNNVWQWLTNNGSDDATLGELLGQHSLIPFQRPVLAASLPYRLLARLDSRARLPASLQHHYRFALYENAAKQNQGTAILTYTVSLPDLAGKSLSLAFVPASAEDEAAIQSFLPEGQLNLAALPKSVPGYLINLKAELRLNDTVVASSAPIVMGRALVGETVYTSPNTAPLTAPERTLSQTEELQLGPVIVGEYRQLAMDLQGGLSHRLQAISDRLKTVTLDQNTSRQQSVGDLLLAGLESYFAANEVYDAWQAQMSGVVAYRAPSMGFARTVLRNVHKINSTTKILMW